MILLRAQVDICRESIVFEHLDDMLDCINTIIEDRELTVERVKNCMLQDEEPLLNCGFRHVCLNVRVRTLDAEQRGVENHVCEVLLMLVNFAELMTPERHDRYIAFRDTIGA